MSDLPNEDLRALRVELERLNSHSFIQIHNPEGIAKRAAQLSGL